jgi:hypothetical protein
MTVLRPSAIGIDRGERLESRNCFFDWINRNYLFLNIFLIVEAHSSRVVFCLLWVSAHSSLENILAFDPPASLLWYVVIHTEKEITK